MTKSAFFADLLGVAAVAAAGSLVGWWFESHAREPEQEERTRVRLRRWQLR